MKSTEQIIKEETDFLVHTLRILKGRIATIEKDMEDGIFYPSSPFARIGDAAAHVDRQVGVLAGVLMTTREEIADPFAIIYHQYKESAK